MKHKHYDMIVAKAANMDLELFFKDSCNSWRPCTISYLIGNESYDYFLCLPQHNENGQCLHWLNGGEIEVSGDGLKWEPYDLSPEHPKYPMTDFTGFEFQFRIAPKKEKRWIIWDVVNGTYHCTLKDDPEGKYSANFRFSSHEIEIEVTG